MTGLKNIEGICFIGIGGIGMSALALYFAKGGFAIAGYDRSESFITRSLINSGCKITYEDSIATLPSLYSDPALKDSVLVVYTPAIPAENNIISFFRNSGYRMQKRSEILGEISVHTDTLAIAGTHGKTTVSTMTATAQAVSFRLYGIPGRDFEKLQYKSPDRRGALYRDGG
jgi:UDP-N-acetylmuramate--alanine ligase